MREEGKVGRGTTFMNGAGEINEMAEGKKKGNLITKLSILSTRCRQNGKSKWSVGNSINRCGVRDVTGGLLKWKSRTCFPRCARAQDERDLSTFPIFPIFCSQRSYVKKKQKKKKALMGWGRNWSEWVDRKGGYRSLGKNWKASSCVWCETGTTPYTISKQGHVARAKIKFGSIHQQQKLVAKHPGCVLSASPVSDCLSTRKIGTGELGTSQ